jgi:hypothetical protein
MQGLANQSNNFMSKNTIKLENRIVLVKLPNGDKFYLEFFNEGLFICAKDKEKKVIVERINSDILIKHK